MLKITNIRHIINFMIMNRVFKFITTLIITELSRDMSIENHLMLGQLFAQFLEYQSIRMVSIAAKIINLGFYAIRIPVTKKVQ